MDTTAAAELGMSIPGAGVDGVGFWDSAAVDQEAWAEEDYDGSPPGKGPIRHGGVGHGRHSAPGFEPMPKRLRNTASESPGHNEMSHVGSYANGTMPGGYDDPASAYKGGRNSHGGSQGGSPYKSNSFQGGYHNETQVGLQSNGGSGSGPGRGKSGTGSIFFKTKLCARFRAGNCPYNSNCNFAHGMEELRKPPPGWEDLVAAQEERISGGNQGTNGGGTDSQGAASGDSQRYQKTRPCKKFLTEGGCPYGERCIFLHEEAAPQSKYAREYSRESAAINITPSSNNGGAGGGGSSNGGPTPRPPNWKTRLCNKWETTGHCPFGEKCHFAHGAAELQKYGGGPIDSPPNSAAQTESKTGGIAPSRSYSDVSSPAPYVLDGHATGNSRQGSLGHHGLQKPAYGSVKTCTVWRGPTDGVSTIYGDWFDENDWDNEGGLIKHGSLNTSYDIGIEIDN